ncbi:hypothetical protein [Sessilibacter corallicola]|uniref:Uncharacterized protein n=1 Tax=Sessilibacter corallicola TaxID=2904075 RepID=A0ABQ0ACM9_9GAMM
MTINETITQIATSVMPLNAEIRVNSQIEHYQASISWKLNNDPERPNKQSKIIIFNVSYEVLEDLTNLSEAQQHDAMSRIESFLRVKLESFNPDHDEPYGAPSPSEDWVVNSTIAGLTS